MTPVYKNKSFTALGALGYGLGGGLSIGLIFTPWIDDIARLPLAPFLLILFGARVMGLLGGLTLGSVFQEKKKRIHFALWSMGAGMISAIALSFALMNIYFFENFESSSLLGIYIRVIGFYGPFVLGSFLIAVSLMHVYSGNFKKSLRFGLQGILAGILGQILVYLLSFLLTSIGRDSTGFYVYFLGRGFFNGGILGFLFKEEITKMPVKKEEAAF